MGLVLSPNETGSVGVELIRIKTRGVIGTDSANTVVAANRPGQIARDAEGRISTLFLRYSNQGDRETRGMDLDLRQGVDLARWGKLGLNAQLSRVFRYAAPLSEGAAPTNGAGNNYFGSIPAWRGATTATWDIGAWSATATWNYVGGGSTRPPGPASASRRWAPWTWAWRGGRRRPPP